MLIENEGFLDHPADEVYPLVRDEMTKLLPFLPDVERVEQLSYDRESPTRVRIVNRWHTKPKMPALVARFLPAEIFSWTDYALWKDDEYLTDYRLEGFGYDVKGTNSFVPDGPGTKIRITADVTIHPEKFHIPRLLFDRVFPLVEDTIRHAIEPNLSSLVRALKDYFAAR